MKAFVFGWIAPLTALIALLGTNCPADGIGGGSDDAGSIIGGLADLGDMEPVANAEAGASSETSGKSSAQNVAASIRANVRQSVPARERSATYRSSELFRNSRVALPLLVADLEPRMILTVQPMSGRSVGARPAAAWTRSSPASVVAPLTEGRQPAAWASVGR